MAQRSEKLQAFVDSLERGFAAARPSRQVATVANALFSALANPESAGELSPVRLPVCRWLPAALNLAKAASAPLARLASAFEAIEPQLAWAVRSSGGPFASDNWPEGHANATLIGPERGLERRDDVTVGVSLLGPNVRYPDHRHPPEEVYLLLTRGRFQHGDSEWFEPGVGGTLHNEPSIKHAMASQDAPLLAIWCLLLK